MGLIVFPLTFSPTNIMQELYGKLFANTAVRYGLLCDILLVFLDFILSSLGEPQDYFQSIKDRPTIMGIIFIFLWMSTLINTIMF
ncbi:MAG: VUT family protein [Candidatus Phlomobacter fragariae]